MGRVRRLVSCNSSYRHKSRECAPEQTGPLQQNSCGLRPVRGRGNSARNFGYGALVGLLAESGLLARAASAWLACAVCLSFACRAAQTTERVFHGEVVVGTYIEPEAYAAFAEGVYLEQRGDYGAAANAYRRAQARDSDSPGIAARLGAVVSVAKGACGSGGAVGINEPSPRPSPRRGVLPPASATLAVPRASSAASSRSAIHAAPARGTASASMI